MARIDIAIPNYNYARYLRQCVDSIARQGIDDLRILIIDNASTDDSADVAREIAASDLRVELRLRPMNLGPHASFNEAIDWARSDYFVILCADDFLPDGALRRAITALDRHPDAHLAFGETLFLHSEDELPSPRSADGSADWRYISGDAFLEEFCRTGRNPVGGPMAVVRTSTQKSIGHYRPELPHTDDVEMWMRFAARGAAVQIADVQAVARVHGANQHAALSNIHLWNLESEAAFETFFAGDGKTVEDAARLMRIARRSLSDRAYWCAVSHLLRGDPGVRDLLAFAVRLRPLSAFLPPLGYVLWRRPDAKERMKALFSRSGRRTAPASVGPSALPTN
ncbi:glycosyltransferase [Rhizobium sp. BK251]|uniref:glycosyltransferase n=1 Tax=Rhizobium sp. BK251 TaxID=2512125 RepID=UPI001043C3BB|nr:glycosyltransferase [Rhizobium sp. BK251]TCL74562.1 glycosyl transferase family 2 [Rhizobium sp. BK251]